MHRDLKPANLVAAPFAIIIANFGLSTVAIDHLLTTFCGTHLCAAPEVYPGNSDGYGPSVDIWSTDVIFLALVADNAQSDRISLDREPLGSSGSAVNNAVADPYSRGIDDLPLHELGGGEERQDVLVNLGHDKNSGFSESCNLNVWQWKPWVSI